MNRLGLKISCFVVSVLIWVQVASTSTVEQTTNLPLRLVGVAEGVTAVGSDLPSQVKVRVQGSKLGLLVHNYFNRYIGEVRIDVMDRDVGPTFSYEMSAADVFTDLVVVGVQPPVRLRLKLDRQVQRMLPVRLVTSGNLPVGVDYLEPAFVWPESLLVSGPERFFPSSGRLVTEAVDLSRLQSSGDVAVSVVAPHEHLVLGSTKARVRFRVAPVLERTLANIPVIPLVDAGQLEVGISPPVVDVMVRGVADSVQALMGDRIMVTVPVGNLPQGVHMVAGEVSMPEWLTLIGLDPAEFQVVVGNWGPAEGDSLSHEMENSGE